MDPIIINKSTMPSFEEIEAERLLSPTPSEALLYCDIDRYSNENEASPKSNLTTSIPRDRVQESSFPQRIELVFTPRSSSPSSPKTNFYGIEISPGSSSETSKTSNCSSADAEYPITERGRSSSFEIDSKSSRRKISSPPSPRTKDTCLQCHLLGLRCSLSSYRGHLAKYKQQTKDLYCARCLRNGESFCITQVVTQKEPQMRSIWETTEYTYESDGVEREVVLKKAEELLEEKQEKERFELPRMSLWKRQLLTPVFGSWVFKEDGGRA